MKTTFISSLQRLVTFSCAKTKEIIRPSENKRSFSSLRSPIKQTFAGIVLLLAVNGNAHAQAFPCNTFVKQVDGIGTVEPRIFKDPSSSNYYLTARSNDSTFISNVNATGTVLTTQILKFANDKGTITDLIVDQVDLTIAGVVKGNNNNYIFKYNYGTATFSWIKSYPLSYLFQNIHQMSQAPKNYIVTGEISGGAITIFQVDRNTGGISAYQNSGFTGEFFSTYDGTDVYGACRYYTTGSLFNPSLYRFDANTGNNIWVNSYIQNPPTTTARIYPVAPIVDQNNLLQLSSGDDAGFGTYLSGPTKTWLLQTDLTGNLMWTNQITIPGCTRPNVKKIINSATGYYLLIDSYNSTSSITDIFYVVKTDKSGNILWANRYGISGQNTVLSGFEDNGFLFLTATSGSYTSSNGLLFLKLDQNGLSDPNCNYIKVVSASSTGYNNTQAVLPTLTNATPQPNSPASVSLNKTRPIENVYCSTTCANLPCNTLTGSLATGVLAFYPFGYGSLNDVSGNGYNLTNTTTAAPTADRNSNPTCAYHFEKSNTEFLTIPATSSGFLNNITTSPFSISLWYRPTNPIVGTRNVGDYELLIGRGTSGLHCPDTWSEWSAGLYDCRKAVVGFDQYNHWQPSSTLGCSAQMAAITGVWHHLAFVYTGSSYNLFVDGVLSTASSGPCGAMSANVGPLMLGKDYTGDLDDIIIYNRALSASEVASLMALNGSCCNGTTSSNRTIQNTGVNTQSVAGGIKVYPNPTSGQISVSAGNSIIRSIAVYSNTGALMATYHFNAAEVSVNMNSLASGVYFLKVVTDTGSSIEKVIKD